MKEYQNTLSNKNIVNAFVHEWAIYAGAKSVLNIKVSPFDIFPPLRDLKTQEVKVAQDIPINTRYDLILGVFPLGMKNVEWNDGSKIIKTQETW